MTNATILRPGEYPEASQRASVTSRLQMGVLLDSINITAWRFSVGMTTVSVCLNSGKVEFIRYLFGPSHLWEGWPS